VINPWQIKNEKKKKETIKEFKINRFFNLNQKKKKNKNKKIKINCFFNFNKKKKKIIIKNFYY